MLGSRLFHYLNTRFQQIFQSNELFGGKSVLLFGDLKQLRPIGDQWIFSPFKSDPYSDIVDTLLWDQLNHLGENFKSFERR